MSETELGFRELLQGNVYITENNKFIVREDERRVSVWIKSKWFKGVDYATLIMLINIADKYKLRPHMILSSKKGIIVTFLK